MQLSPQGRKLIQGFEGLSLTAYPDPPLSKGPDGSENPNQNYSIGYGHSGARRGQTITRDEADRLFDVDAVKYEAAVSYTTPIATPQQFDAMTSLTYNIGTAGFAKSTVARLHNMGDYAGAADAFLMWNKAAGAVNQVLAKRRDRERSVYLNGYGYYPEPVYQPATQPAVPMSVLVTHRTPWTQIFVGSLLTGLASYLIHRKTNWLPFKRSKT